MLSTTLRPDYRSDRWHNLSTRVRLAIAAAADRDGTMGNVIRHGQRSEGLTLVRSRRDGASSLAPRQLTCTRRSAPHALAASAMRRAAAMCTSSNLKRGVSYSAPIKLTTTLDCETAF